MEKLWEHVRDLTVDKQTIHIIAVILIIITAILFYGFKEDSQTITIDTAGTDREETERSGAGESSSARTAEEIYVDVDGAVKSPGVYMLPEGSRVFEALEKAGGLTAKADTSGINQAERVKDGQKITVPKKGSGQPPAAVSSGSSTGTSGSESSSKVNINTAGSDELQTISGVGPATAQKIIDYRTQNGPFASPEDLKNVSGIGDKTFEKMKDSITI